LLSLGTHQVRWFDTQHLPHAWECGFLFEERTRTFCPATFSVRLGDKLVTLTESDILGPSGAFRARMDYYSHTKRAAADAGMGSRLLAGHTYLQARQRMAR
jgi:hypothetical protein